MNIHSQFLVLALACLPLLSACGSSGGGGGIDSSTLAGEQKQIVATFVDDVVLPTYEDLANKSVLLETSVKELSTTPSEATLTAARQAWTNARTPWERSESFLFGPVNSYGYDPALDSWPLDHGGLNQAISQYASSAFELSSTDPSLKGFHAIEFLLFGYNKSKVLADFTASEYKYLLALAADHRDVTAKIQTAWTTGVAGNPAFASSFKGAGDAGNSVYLSAQAAAQEMIEGMAGIADEVANNKIAQPYNQADPNLVESQYSFNSLEDFQNNVRSIRTVYFGSLSDTPANASISAFVAARNPSLDTKVVASIDAALAALAAIPDPFRDAILDPASHDEIEAAQAALQDLLLVVDSEVRPLILP